MTKLFKAWYFWIGIGLVAVAGVILYNKRKEDEAAAAKTVTAQGNSAVA